VTFRWQPSRQPVTLVLPVKELASAKTRLTLPQRERSAIALRLFDHTLSVAPECKLVGRVLVVTKDPQVVQIANSVGVSTIAEPQRSDLNIASELGRQHARQIAPQAGVAVMVSDLPGLTTGDLTGALQEFLAGGVPMFVADRAGTGTTLVVHPARVCPPYRFGPNSARCHLAAGYRPALDALRGLREDLDTVQDLESWLGSWVTAGVDTDYLRKHSLSRPAPPRISRKSI
jgi:2-phospho-L-lactate guanylyltransferase